MRAESSPTGARRRTALLVVAVLSAGGCHHGGPGGVGPGWQQGAAGRRLVDGVPFVPQHALSDCGAAALAMALGYWGRGASIGEIRRGLRDDGRGFYAGDLRDEIRRRGLSAYLIAGTFGDLEGELDAGRPIIVGLIKRDRRRSYGHYEVVVGMDTPGRRILTLDPATLSGWREASFEAFQSEWAPSDHLTIVVMPGGSGTSQANSEAGPLWTRPG